MEITRLSRVPLALPVFVTRRGHSDSALAEPVAHGTKRQRISLHVLTGIPELLRARLRRLLIGRSCGRN